MVVSHDCRLIMGPGRQGEVFGIVAMVPDGKFTGHCVVIIADYA
jgi:salicylate hydroxylase